MKKIAMVLGMLSLAGLAHAADPLNGTVWKTIDDKTKQPKALVKFTEQSNGTLSASIQSILVAGKELIGGSTGAAIGGAIGGGAGAAIERK